MVSCGFVPTGTGKYGSVYGGEKKGRGGIFIVLVYSYLGSCTAPPIPSKCDRDRQALSRWIRERNLRELRLVELLKIYEINVVYTPAYHPECQPIERWWALFKRRWEDADPNLKYDDRVKAAYDAIPVDYAQKCIQSSLAWCWRKYDELALGGVAPLVVAVIEEDGIDSGADSDESV